MRHLDAFRTARTLTDYGLARAGRLLDVYADPDDGRSAALDAAAARLVTAQDQLRAVLDEVDALLLDAAVDVGEPPFMPKLGAEPLDKLLRRAVEPKPKVKAAA